MISFIRGTVQALTANSVVLDVSGIGMELIATGRCRNGLQVGQAACVPASLVVREESWTLYGFADADERACFQSLQLSKGVGPRVAVNLLGVLTPDQLRQAIAAGDADALTAAPGIGVKGAQRLVIDLRDRLGPASGLPDGVGALPAHQGPGWQRDVQLALVGLGWTASDASTAVARVSPAAELGGAGCNQDGNPDVSRLLRLALATLDRPAQAR